MFDMRKTPKFCETEKRIVCLFGDIVGFKSWIKRSGRDNFKNTFLKIVDTWSVFKPGANLYKTLGDGFLAVYELNEENIDHMPKRVVADSIECIDKINELIEDSFNPKPSGFRIRICEGDALKIHESFEGQDTHDYISYYINMAKELLKIEEETPIIIHSNFKEIDCVEGLDGFIKFEKLPLPLIDRTAIFNEDLNMLWRMRLTDEKLNEDHQNIA